MWCGEMYYRIRIGMHFNVGQFLSIKTDTDLAVNIPGVFCFFNSLNPG